MSSSILLGILLTFFSFEKICAQENYFEGRIIYRTVFEIKDSTKRALSFSKYYPLVTIQHFKEGNSFEISDKGETKTYLYRKSENRTYQDYWSKDTLFFFDCSKKGREILNYTITKKADTILGLACDKLQISYNTGTSSYYFNQESLKIDPKWYSQLTYINWDFISSISKSIVLKTVIERADYRITNTAISIHKEKISDSIFAIPINVILVEDK